MLRLKGFASFFWCYFLNNIVSLLIRLVNLLILIVYEILLYFVLFSYKVSIFVDPTMYIDSIQKNYFVSFDRTFRLTELQFTSVIRSRCVQVHQTRFFPFYQTFFLVCASYIKGVKMNLLNHLIRSVIRFTPASTIKTSWLKYVSEESSPHYLCSLLFLSIVGHLTTNNSPVDRKLTNIKNQQHILLKDVMQLVLNNYKKLGLWILLHTI